MSYFLAGLLQGLFWFVALGTCLWLMRKFAPSFETAFFKVGAIEGIKMLIRRIRLRLQGLKAETPVQSEPAPKD
jgi:hypothetical protein